MNTEHILIKEALLDEFFYTKLKISHALLVFSKYLSTPIEKSKGEIALSESDGSVVEYQHFERFLRLRGCVFDSGAI